GRLRKKMARMPAVISFRFPPCCRHWKNMGSMQPLAEPGAMKRKHELKNGSFLTVMNLDSGIPKISGRSYGICIMAERITESISGYFRSVIGRKWMFGSIFLLKIWRYPVFTWRTNERWLSVPVLI